MSGRLKDAGLGFRRLRLSVWSHSLPSRVNERLGLDNAVGNVVAAVDVNHVLQDEVVTFALGQIDDDAVGILLERGEFFMRRRL